MAQSSQVTRIETLSKSYSDFLPEEINLFKLFCIRDVQWQNGVIVCQVILSLQMNVEIPKKDKYSCMK